MCGKVRRPLNWIISNQLGRRNLNPNQIAYLRGKRYENEKKIVSNAGGVNQYTVEVNAQIGHQPKNNSTAKIIANEYGVGYNTIRRNEHFAKTVDILPENVKEDVLANKTYISQTDAYTITKFDAPTKKKFIKENNGITFFWQRKIPQRNLSIMFAPEGVKNTV